MALNMTPLNEGSYFIAISPHCEYFYSADVYDVVGYLPNNVMYFPSEISAEPYNGYTWLKFQIDGTEYYAAYEKNRIKLVTNTWVKYRSEGIDVSKYQGNVDWNQVKNAGYEFALIRVVSTSSSIYVDPYFEQNIVNAKAAGMKVGAYIYTYAKDEATLDAEIEKAYTVLTKYKYEYPIYLDFEDPYIQSNGKARNTELCRHGFEKLLSGGFYPGLYTGHYWSYTYIDAAALSDYPLWLAHYTSQTTSQLNYGIWQYGGATVPGVTSGACDVNHGYIDLEPYITWNGYNGLAKESVVTPVTGVVLSPSFLSLRTGETGIISAVVSPENASDKTLSWSVEPEGIATVENGTVRAMMAGQAEITAISTNGISGSCTVTVEDLPSPVPEQEDLNVRICPRLDSEAQWMKYDPVPLLNEMCVVDGVGVKYGDGIHRFSELKYQSTDTEEITNEEIDAVLEDVFGNEAQGGGEEA